MDTIEVPTHFSIVYALRRRLVLGGRAGVKFPDGWDAVLAEFLFLASELVPSFRVSGVEIKYAELRLDVDAGADDPVASALLQTLVRRAVRRAEVTCEDCGELGEVRVINGWLRILCRYHSGEPVDVADMIDEPLADLGVAPARDTIRRLADEIFATEKEIAEQDTKSKDDPGSKWWTVGRPRCVADVEEARKGGRRADD